MITRARVSGCFGSPVVAGAVLLLSAIAGAALTGSLLGLLGSALQPAMRALLAVVAVSAVAVGVVVRPVPWQLDRETAPGWLLYQDWRTAAYNGLALGLGFTTRIGFWLFYLVPLTAFVVADPVLGAIGYAVFAVSRVGVSVLLAAADIWIGGGITRVRPATDLLAVAALGALCSVLVPLL
ncbi:hypothetical protein FHR32_005728 [Streptosporangium album]|uniref:Uncharacterized protein n=1 Tax=Streptosporangium album TaxID=47479 RepID=A0A7W7S1S3_9ACTN|nr:hypothetical protein [Streptosporangium album]MBB4941351.1 hypothetical protein [Streptosporangium album]